MKVNNSKLIYKTITAYKEQNKKFGFSPKGVFWQNDKTQIARFNSLINGILTQDLDGGISISDFGCGYGAFYNYIKNKKFMNNSSFIGYDIVDDFIFEAKKKLSQCRMEVFRQTSPRNRLFIYFWHSKYGI